MSGSAAQLTAWNRASPRRDRSWIIRATSSLPDPVGPRISTEMSDLAAVRIHSKTISIFSSRPIISRKRCTDGDWSSVEIAARRSRKAVDQAARSGRPADGTGSATGSPPSRRDDAEIHELANAVGDVEAQPAEGRHQALEVEGVVGTGRQEAQQPRAQRRLHERL